MSRVRDLADNNVVFVDGITTADITEHTNLFFTDARADARLALKMVDEDNMSSNSATHMPTQQSVKAYVDTEVASLVDSSPGTLDTLNELAAALGDDPNFATTVTNSIATKLPLSGGTLTGNLNVTGTITSTGIGGFNNYIDLSTTSNRGKIGYDNLNLYLGSTSSTGEIHFKNNIGSTDAPHNSGDTKMVITDSGVGIGNVNPAHPLHIYEDGGYYASVGRGNSAPGGSDPWLGLFNNTNIASATFGWGIYDSNANGSFQIWNKNNNTTGYNALTILRGGNVGIGTTNPDRPLHILSSSNNAPLKIDTSDGTQACIAYALNGTDIWYAGVDLNANGGEDFFIYDATAGAGNRLLIDTNGNVGIGTTSPDTILHISSAGSPQIRVQDTTNDVRGQFTANDSNVVIGTVSNHSLNFATNNGNQVTLAASNLYPTNNNTSQLGLSNRVWNKIWTTNFVANGNVGIGTSSPLAKLHIQGNAVIGDIQGYETTHPGESGATLHIHDTVGDGGTNNGQVSFGDETRVVISTGAEAGGGQGYQGSLWFGTSDHPAGGADLNVGTQWNYYVAGIASKTTNDTGSQNVSFGNLEFYTKGSNSTSSAALAMTISESQNVGIGTTSPVTKLHVQDNFDPNDSYGYALIENTTAGSGQAANAGVNVKSYSGTSQFMQWENYGLRFGSRHVTNTGLGDVYITAGADSTKLVIKASGNVGIGNTNPSATLHVEDTVTGGGNSGHMKVGHTRTRTFYAGISSSENRWYKVLNYSSGNMFTGKIQIYITRSGGFNQTGAHKEYRASLGGYSNSVYGPLSLSGDGGEGGVASLEIGTDAGVYLRVNTSIYGGTVYVTFSGQGGMSWAYSNSSYSTSLP